MTDFNAQQEWRQRKLRLKEKIATLTASNIALVKGMQDEMVSRLHVRLGNTKEEILAIIAKL
jgi:hypothetical protein